MNIDFPCPFPAYADGAFGASAQTEDDYTSLPPAPSNKLRAVHNKGCRSTLVERYCVDVFLSLVKLGHRRNSRGAGAFNRTHSRAVVITANIAAAVFFALVGV